MPPTAQEREGGRDGHVRETEQSRQGRDVADLRVDLLRAHHRTRYDRRARGQRGGHESPAAEALQPVAVGERLAQPLEALGPHGHHVAVLEQPLGVRAARQRGTGAAGQRRGHRQRHGQVGGRSRTRPAWSCTATLVEVVEREHRRGWTRSAQRLRRDVIAPITSTRNQFSNSGRHRATRRWVEVLVRPNSSIWPPVIRVARISPAALVPRSSGQGTDVRWRASRPRRGGSRGSEHLGIDRQGLDLPQRPHGVEELIHEAADLSGGSVTAGGGPRKPSPTMRSLRGRGSLTPPGASSGWLRSNSGPSLTLSVGSGRAPAPRAHRWWCHARAQPDHRPRRLLDLGGLALSEARVTSGSVPESTGEPAWPPLWCTGLEAELGAHARGVHHATEPQIPHLRA